MGIDRWYSICAYIMCGFAFALIIVGWFVDIGVSAFFVPWILILFAFLFIIMGMLARIIWLLNPIDEESEE